MKSRKPKTSPATSAANSDEEVFHTGTRKFFDELLTEATTNATKDPEVNFDKGLLRKEKTQTPLVP